jgi:hypothetical protein
LGIVNGGVCFRRWLYVEILAARVPDHAPVLIACEQKSMWQLSKKFRFKYDVGGGKKKKQKETIKKVWRPRQGSESTWSHVVNNLNCSRRAIIRETKEVVQSCEEILRAKIEKIRKLQGCEGAQNYQVLE